jgi:hypothetical protein
MPKSIGDSMSFSGGAETTPTVSVETYRCPGSMNDRDPTLRIFQENVSIVLSPATMQAILDWYNRP